MAFASQNEEIIGEIGDGPTSRIIVRAGITKNKSCYVDIRKHYPDPATEEWKPTPKGIRLYAEQIDELLPLLRQADEKLAELLSFKPKAAA